MATETLPDTTLAAGQSLHLALDAGTVLLAAQGRVRIDEAPQWLADTVVPAHRLLEEGQTHAVAGRGWVRVTALAGTGLAAGARLRVLPAAVPRRGVVLPRFVRMLWGT